MEKLTFPIVLAIIGAIPLLLALIQKVPTPWGTIGPLSAPQRWACGVFGCLLLGIAIFAGLTSQQQPANARSTAAPDLSTPVSAAVAQEPEKLKLKLAEKIKAKQHDAVGDSLGTRDYQCFTDAKLRKFKQDRMPDKINNALRMDKGFIDIVLAVQTLEPADRQKLLDDSAHTYRESWGQLGIDPATASQNELRRGQTDAGSEAERLIAESVVALVQDLCQRPVEELKRLSR